MVTNQAYLFFIFVINGIIIGLLFDFFRILRRTFKTKDIITYIEDILFWILTGVILLYSIFTYNNGEIRLFMFLGVLLGVITYILFVSKYVIKINVAILLFFKNIIMKIFRFISIPFTCIFHILKKIFFRPFSFIIINIRKYSTNIYKNITNCFKKTKNTIKN